MDSMTCQTVAKVLREDMSTMSLELLITFAEDVMGMSIIPGMSRQDIEDECVAIEQTCFVS